MLFKDVKFFLIEDDNKVKVFLSKMVVWVYMISRKYKTYLSYTLIEVPNK